MSLVAAALFSRCAAVAPPPPPPPPTPTPTPFATPAPRADVWDAPRGVLLAEGYEVTDEDRSKGVLVARLAKPVRTAAERKSAITALSRIAYVDDPRVGGAAERMSEYAITIRVRVGSDEAPGIAMAVKAEFVVIEPARRDGAAGELNRPVPSRGVLEKQLLEKIRKSLEE